MTTLKKKVIALLAIIALVLVGYSGYHTLGDKPIPVAQPPTTSESPDADDESPVVEPPQIVKVGESVKVDAIQFTVDAAKPYTGKDAKAQNGGKLYDLTISSANISDSDAQFYPHRFRMTDHEGKELSPVGPTPIQVAMTPHAQATHHLIYEVPNGVTELSLGLPGKNQKVQASVTVTIP